LPFFLRQNRQSKLVLAGDGAINIGCCSGRYHFLRQRESDLGLVLFAALPYGELSGAEFDMLFVC
jgi:hypothetical protein